MYNVAKIFELLKERKLEQKDLAKEISISEGNFSSWKRGLTKPSDKVMQKIADYFRLPLSDFYVYDESQETKKDSPIGIGKSKEHIELMTEIEDLTPEELRVVLATAKALTAQRGK